MNMLCLGLNHKTTPVHIRERFSIIETQILAALRALLDLPHIKEAAILSTCNRTEVYVSSDNIACAKEQLYSYFFLIHRITPKQVNKYLYFFTDKNVAKHLFHVSSGLDSLVVGEGQILGQVKQALKYAEICAYEKNILHMLFLQAMKTGKRVRTETKISRGAASVSFAAVELIKKKFSSLKNLQPLVIGTGKMGRQAISYLHNQGVKPVLLTNRSYEKAVAIAKDFGGIPVKFEELYSAVKKADIIISSTTSPHLVITKDRLRKAREEANYRPLFIIDIAVPRDVDPDVKKIKNVALYNIDDLQDVVSASINTRKSEAESAEKIIAEEVENFTNIMNIQRVAPLIQKIQHRYYALLDEFIGSLPEKETEAFEKFGKKFIGRILHRPITKIKELSSDEKFIQTMDYLKQIFA